MTDDTPAPWLHLLTPIDAAWREKEIGKGRNPDPYIENNFAKQESGHPLTTEPATIKNAGARAARRLQCAAEESQL